MICSQMRFKDKAIWRDMHLPGCSRWWLRDAAILLFAVCLATVASGQGGRGKRDDQGQFRQLGAQISAAQRAGDLSLAEDLARQRILIAKNIGKPKAMGVAYLSLGSILRLRGKFADAEVILRQSMVMTESSKGRNSYQAIHVLFNLGALMTAQSRYQEAETTLRDGLERQLAAAPRDVDTIHALNLLANVERLLGRLDEAASLLRQAEAVDAKPAESRHAKMRNNYWLARRREQTQFYWGRLAFHRGNFADAVKYAQNSVDAVENLEDKAHPDLVSRLTLLGSAFLQLGQLDAAEAALRRALTLAEHKLGKENKETGQVAMLFGQVLTKRGKFAEAEPRLRQAVNNAIKSNVLEQVANYERNLGHFLIKRSQPVEALEHYRRSLDAVDQLFAQTQEIDEDTRENFVSKFAAFYFETLQILTRLNQARPKAGYDREALAVVSRTQSRIFTELLRKADTSRLAEEAVFKQLHERQLGLKTKLTELRRARVLVGKEEPPQDEDEDQDDVPQSQRHQADPLIQARADAQRARIAEQQSVLERDLAEVETALWEKYPRFMELIQPRPVTVDLIQQRLLKPGETLLSYFLLPDSALTFVVNPESFHMLQTPHRRDQIAAWVAAVRKPEELAASGFENLAQLDPKILHRLYQALFEPILPHLKDGQRLLVIGDGPLHTLPLEMLVTRYGEDEQRAFDAARADPQGTQLGEYATLPYLGQRFRFAYLPSLSALASVRLYRKPAVRYDQELVSFADPVFDAGGRTAVTQTTLAGLARSIRSSTGKLSIPRLPETADEAREIAKILGGRNTVLLRESAQEHTAKTLDMRATRYLHFATHGLLGGEFIKIHEALAAVESDEPTEGGAGGAQRNPAVASSVPLQIDEEPVTARKSAEQGQPALVMSLSGGLQGEDGLLTMTEVIGRMNLNAQLVVLSACNTAGEGGDANNGEGFAGLTRAFMYAGAQGLLVSHWSVESTATQVLMTEMFRHLRSGDDNLSALEDARAFIRNSTSPGEDRTSRAHPYFWAPFVYVGD